MQWINVKDKLPDCWSQHRDDYVNDLKNNLCGSGNIAIGDNAIGNNSTGFYNVAIGVGTKNCNFSNNLLLGRGAESTCNNQIVFGSSNYNLGSVTTESVSQAKTWTVIINGCAQKILLA